jgi:BREX system ATP-binding protein BrxC/D
VTPELSPAPRDETPTTLGRAEARSIVRSLADGVVPRTGIRLFTAGRQRWLGSLEQDLVDLAEEAAEAGAQEGHLRIVNGRNGDGKTHLLHLLRDIALDRGFAVSYVVVSHQTPLHRWDRVYAAIGRGLATRHRNQPDSTGLRSILDPRAPDPAIAADFHARAARIRSLPGLNPAFANATYRYCTEQTVNLDAAQDMLLLGAWLEGGGQRPAGLAIASRIDQSNGAEMLRSLARTLRYFGLAGLVVLLDEVESVLALSAPQRRQSYQTLRLLVDRENTPPNTLLVASTTPPMFADRERGLPSYPALWSRLRPGAATDLVDYNATSIDLTRTPLTGADYRAIGRCIRLIHARARDWAPAERVSDAFLDAAAEVAEAGPPLFFSPTRVLVKLVAGTLELCYQHPDAQPSTDDLEAQFDRIDRALASGLKVEG